jgi:hypothetical protein
MSIVEKSSPSHAVEFVADSEMPATTSICIALTVALLAYTLGTAVFRQGAVAHAPHRAAPIEMSFHGP